MVLPLLHQRRPAPVLAAALAALTACSERGAESPAAPQVIDLVAGSGRDILDSLGITGEPLDFSEVVEVDWPDDPPTHFFDDAALVQAVSAVDGKVHIWFKPPEAPKLTDRVRGPPGERKTLTQPVPAAISREGRAFLESQGADITLPFRHVPAVVARIAPELAPLVRGHPLVDYVEPVAVHRPGVPGPLRRARSARSGRSPKAIPALVAAQVIPDNIQKIRAPNAWPITRGEGRQVVVMDLGPVGGLDHHADLPQLDPFGCLETLQQTDNCADDSQGQFRGHASAVAGVALALDNTIDVVGVAPQVDRWVSIRRLYWRGLLHRGGGRCAGADPKQFRAQERHQHELRG